MIKPNKTIKMTNNDVDVVIIWVDGSDEEWLHDKSMHSESITEKKDIDFAKSRYRDWDNIQYLFRGIEEFMPWVRKVHFVTYGHVPNWLNLDYHKLNFVKHEDYIPKEYLPTFSANPIELNIHRIKDLAEKFIFFNDDMFITKPMNKSDFFKNQVPVGKAALNFIPTSDIPHDIFTHIILNDITILNKHFNKKSVLRKNLNKWLSHEYSPKTIIKNVLLMPYGPFTGLSFPHMPSAFLKSTYSKLWTVEQELLDQTSRHKFRDIKDVNQYIMTAWQIASGDFCPKDIDKISKGFYDAHEQKNEITKAIINQEYSMICINDSDTIPDFDELKNQINSSFEKIFNKKSLFEV